jgi:hypothetical protein
MTRRLFNLLTVLSLLLCVAALALWARSKFRYDCVQWMRGQTGYINSSHHGFFEIKIAYPLNIAPNDADHYFSAPLGKLPDFYYERYGPGLKTLGVRLIRHEAQLGPTRTMHTRGVRVRYFVPAALLGTLPLVQAAAYARRRRRANAGRCPRCDYDLRATPGRCPECGSMAGEAY